MDRTTIFKVSRQSSVEDRELVLKQIYSRILERQPLKFERLELKKVEQDFLKGKIGVRRFIRLLGASRLYLNEFYFKTTTPKFVEICFQQLMGRSLSSEEMHQYADILARQGPTKLVSAVLDTEEYRKAFGCFTVPYFRERTVYSTPYAYLDGQALLHQSFGQRQQSVSRLVTRHLNPLDGQDDHFSLDQLLLPADNNLGEGTAVDVATLQKQLKEILMTLDRSAAKQVVEKLPTAQRRRLQAILS